MKLLHLGDLHLGKSVSDFSMIEDQRYILGQIIDIIKKQQIDAVLIAGDVYDKTVPSEDAVRLLDEFLVQLSSMNTETFLISGNHDSDERLGFGSSLFEANHIHIFTKYQGTLYKQELCDAYGKVNIYLLPFVKASQVRHFFPKETIASYEDAIRVLLSHAKIDRSERNIIMAHQFVAGKSADPRLGGSEGIMAHSVGTIEKIGADCFDDFDYVALGHIHSPQQVGRQTVRYSGSILKYSLSEVNDPKSVPIVTLGQKGERSVELVPLRPRRDMRHLKGKLRQLLDPNHIQSPDDYIYVTLTDEAPIQDAMDIFRQYYPNTMKIMYDNAHTREIEQVDITNVTQERDFDELLSDFYQMMYGISISKEEMQIMREVATEAGVIDETD